MAAVYWRARVLVSYVPRRVYVIKFLKKSVVCLVSMAGGVHENVTLHVINMVITCLYTYIYGVWLCVLVRET